MGSGTSLAFSSSCLSIIRRGPSASLACLVDIVVHGREDQLVSQARTVVLEQVVGHLLNGCSLGLEEES